ncbi:MAG: ASPIC/UnbV domain-containing protein [Cytophagales bacterium]|nr:ASPIC/UnbV domain-containing protein [Cytophagales bacterium]
MEIYDLVVNNINAPARVFRNNSDSSRYKNISLSITSKGKNTFAVGTTLTAYCGNKKFVADNFITRGFQSSVDPIVTMGFGAEIKVIDSIQIRWPDNGYSVMYNVPVNRRLNIVREELQEFEQYKSKKYLGKIFSLEPLTSKIFKHQRSGLVDFNRDRLLPHVYSNEMPALIKGDINNDGFDEIYVGGGKDQFGIFIDFASGIKALRSSQNLKT